MAKTKRRSYNGQKKKETIQWPNEKGEQESWACLIKYPSFKKGDNTFCFSTAKWNLKTKKQLVGYHMKQKNVCSKIIILIAFSVLLKLSTVHTKIVYCAC
jgi:hypothetical protein